MTDPDAPLIASKPTGRDDVMRALVDATIALIVKKGLSMSVREIAQLADVNHGLIHAYFGSKDGLLTAAFEDIQRRADLEKDERGFPPPDIAGRRGGEIAKALARVILEDDGDPFPRHSVTTAWREALAREQPELTALELNTRIISATSLSLGYTLFADYFADVLGLDDATRAYVTDQVLLRVADVGGITRRDSPDVNPTPSAQSATSGENNNS